MTDSLFKNAPKPVETAASSSPSSEQRQDLGSALLCHLTQAPSSKEGVSSRAFDDCPEVQAMIPGPAGLSGAVRVVGQAALRAEALSQAANKVVVQLGQLNAAHEVIGPLKDRIHSVSSMTPAAAREFVAELSQLTQDFPALPELRWAVAKFKLASLPYLW